MSFLQPLLAAAMVFIGVVVSPEANLSRTTKLLLPDLRIAVPGSLHVEGSVLGFTSAADNVGAGPLVIDGRRHGRATVMTTTQRISYRDGSVRRRSLDDRLRYQTNPDHEHWHLKAFMRYELRDADTGELVRPSLKVGFCLGDRFEAARDVALPDRPEAPRFRSECGKDQPRRRRLTEGISVGYGDDYKAFLEGQSVDLSGLPAGRYLLVHLVNPNRTLRESRYDNNEAALVIAVSWPNGTDRVPVIDVIERRPAS